MLSTFDRCAETESVSAHASGTAAHRHVINNGANGIGGASSRARVGALVAQANAVSGTVGVENTLGSAASVRIAPELREASARAIVADRVGSARRGIALVDDGRFIASWKYIGVRFFATTRPMLGSSRRRCCRRVSRSRLTWYERTELERISLVAVRASADRDVIDDRATSSGATGSQTGVSALLFYASLVARAFGVYRTLGSAVRRLSYVSLAAGASWRTVGISTVGEATAGRGSAGIPLEYVFRRCH